MFHKLTGAALAVLLSFGTAQAATVGAFTFDDNAFADSGVIARTIGGTRGPASNPAGLADGNLSSAANLNDSFVEFLFTDNVLINGAGDDLVIFTNTNNNVIRLTTGYGDNDQWYFGSTTFVGVNETGNTSGYGLAAVSFDLSDLGFADGAEVTGGLYLSRGGVFTTVWDVAALNSRSASPNAQVPLPAGLPLLLGALGAFGAMRRFR